jgi:hypothetical protein
MGRSRMIAALVSVGALALAGCSSGGGSKSSTSSTSPEASAATTTTGAASAQSVTITPSTGLTDGQTVQVVGKGYSAGKMYGLTECANKGQSTTAGDCDLRTIKVATADSSGTVTAQYTVAKGPFGSNNIVCTNPPGCIVSVADAGSANPTDVADATIAFAS